jgi:hypothetical protein
MIESAEGGKIREEEDKQNEEEIKSCEAFLSATYFYSIGGLVTKSTIEFIR